MRIWKEFDFHLKVVDAAIKSFSEIDIPQNVKILTLSNNRIIDFVGMNDFDDLEILNIDNNPILSFRGFPKTPKLKEISLIGSPICELTNFRILTIIATGKQIEKINGVQVTSQEISVAYSYGDIENTSKFISRGWLPRGVSYKPVSGTSTNTEDRTVEKLYKKIPQTPSKNYHKLRIGIPRETLQETSRNLTPKRNLKSKTKPKAKGQKPKESPFTTENIENDTDRINAVLQNQEDDPISVRAVRIMRTVGYDKPQISEFIRSYYSVAPEKKAEIIQSFHPYDDETSQQLQKLDDMISVLAQRVNAVRNQNATYSRYDQMLNTAATSLFENYAIISGEKDSPKEEEIKPSTEFDENRYNYLRAAILETFGWPSGLSDDKIIRRLHNIMNGVEEEEEEEEEESDDELNITLRHSQTIDILQSDEEDSEEEKELNLDDLGIKLRKN